MLLIKKKKKRTLSKRKLSSLPGPIWSSREHEGQFSTDHFQFFLIFFLREALFSSSGMGRVIHLRLASSIKIKLPLLTTASAIIHNAPRGFPGACASNAHIHEHARTHRNTHRRTHTNTQTKMNKQGKYKLENRIPGSRQRLEISELIYFWHKDGLRLAALGSQETEGHYFLRLRYLRNSRRYWNVKTSARF